MNSVINHEKLALRWFFGAGAAAIIFTLFLVWSDDYLSNSKSEDALLKKLREVRTAQSSMPTRDVDERQIQVGHDLTTTGNETVSNDAVNHHE